MVRGNFLLVETSTIWWDPKGTNYLASLLRNTLVVSFINLDTRHSPDILLPYPTCQPRTQFDTEELSWRWDHVESVAVHLETFPGTQPDEDCVMDILLIYFIF